MMYLPRFVKNNGYADLRECPTAPELPRLCSLINTIPGWVFISHVSVKNSKVSRPALVANEGAMVETGGQDRVDMYVRGSAFWS